MRSLALTLFGLLLLVVQTAVATLVPMHSYAPNLMLPIAIFLGVSAEVHILRGAVISFVLGYLLDAFCGSPIGLQTFVLVAAYFVSRGAGLRLSPQGSGFQMLLTFVMALLTGGTILALRGIFESRDLLMQDVGQSAVSIVRAAGVTALLAPPIFAASRRIEAALSQRREQRSVAA